MNISFDKHKIIKWSGSAAKLLAVVFVLTSAAVLYQFLSLFTSLTGDVKNTAIASTVSSLLLYLLQALVFYGYSRLVTEFLDKKDEKRS